jgi:hypothetical protein
VASTIRPVTQSGLVTPMYCPNSADYAWLQARTPRKP